MIIKQDVINLWEKKNVIWWQNIPIVMPATLMSFTYKMTECQKVTHCGEQGKICCYYVFESIIINIIIISRKL